MYRDASRFLPRMYTGVISNYAQQMEMIRMDVTCWYLRISFMFGNDDIRLFHLQFARMEINYAREI